MARLWQSPRGGQARALLASACLASACLVVACVGTGEGVPNPDSDPGNEPRTWTELSASVFEPMCAASCHRGGAARKGLNLEPSKAIKNLVGVEATEVPGLLRVAPGAPDQSYLIVKVVAADPRRVGARMPRNGPPWVSAAQVRALRRWIRDGATADWEASDEPDVLMVPFDGGALAGDAASLPDGISPSGASPDGGAHDAGAAEVWTPGGDASAPDAVMEDGW